MNTSLFLGIYQELLRAWPNRWLGYFIALIAASIVGVVVIALPDQYESKAKVYINSEVILKPLLQGLAVENDDNSRVRILRVLQQTLINEKNVERLIQTPDMGFDASTAAGRSRAASIIKSGVTVLEEEENLFSLTFIDTNPIRARNVAHGLLTLFLETNVVESRAELQSARDFLDKQIAEYQVKLREIERQISDFQLTNVESLGETAYQARLRASRAALRDAQLARQLAVEVRDRIQAKVNGAGGSAVLVATDQTFPALIDRMSALQGQLNALLLQYTDKHPDVVATRREIMLLSEQYGLSSNLGEVAAPFGRIPGQVSPASAIDSAVGQPVAGQSAATPVSQSQPSGLQMQLLQANFAVLDAERKVTAAQASLRQIEVYSATAPEAEATLEQLNRDYALLKENHDQLLRRRESARITNAAGMSSSADQFRIIQSPNIPKAPSGPDRSTFLLLGALLSVGAGGALAYALGLLRGTFVSAAEAEAALGLPVIARLTNRHGMFSRVSQSADALILLGGVVAIFIAAYVLSSATGLLVPIRAEIYHLLETDFGHLLSSLI